MENHSHSSHPHSHHSTSSDNATSHVNSAQDHVTDVGGSTNGARYRLMSPAKLPISRSTCITIPPGLSPTSFLESPVLLSNIKAEPSPTTGSFFKQQLMQGSSGSAAFPLDKSFAGGTVDEKTSSGFEFRFHTGVSSTLGLSSVGMSIPVGMSRNGLFNHQDQLCSQSSASASASLASQSLVVARQDSSVYESIDESSQVGQSNTGIQASVSEHKDSSSSVSAERTSEDGFNWRKYGQKLVKGSEFPRSYYKCTYPNCEVKKIFERSPSGQIMEIVYKGSHDHPKPQNARRHNSGTLLSIQEDKLDKGLALSGQEDKINTNSTEQNGSPMLSPLQANEEAIDGSGLQFQGINDDEDDDPFLKRRKMEDGIDVTPVVKPIREPRVVVQTVSEVDILDDGYRWRKYGQKVVRGNPNPRSYYKCTNSGCTVRKHVERASHDPKAVITTYEGKHNHDVPTARNTSHEFAATTQYTKMRPQDSTSTSISLDLGVGIARDQQLKPMEVGCYDIVNAGLNVYGSRENRVEARNFQTPSINASNQCQQNLGRILMGP